MTPLDRFKLYSARIEQFNPALNAFIHLRLAEAEAEAKAAQARHDSGNPASSIDGWCFGIKANIAIAGLPHHAGIGAYRRDIATADAETIRRLKAAGAVILGIVNMHEGALGATTDNLVFGRTQNPWRPGFTPGGSSGGSGAAVSAGLCDVALGSDTMGSVRIPSAYCGVQGIKPSPGLVSQDGIMALSHTLDTVGPHARSVASLRAALGVMTGQLLTAAPCSLAGMNLAVWDGFGREDIDPAVAEGFAAAVARIEAAGALADHEDPPGYQYGRSRRSGLLVSEVEANTVHAAKLSLDPEGFSPLFRKLMAWGRARPAEEVEAAYRHLRQVETLSERIFERHEFVIAPVAPQTAFAFDAPVPENQADFTAWANLAGLPAAAVYSGISPDGLPLSVQVIGPAGSDARVLDLAEALEALFGPPPEPPPLQR